VDEIGFFENPVLQVYTHPQTAIWIGSSEHVLFYLNPPMADDDLYERCLASAIARRAYLPRYPALIAATNNY
jgi:hypothetical protein